MQIHLWFGQGTGRMLNERLIFPFTFHTDARRANPLKYTGGSPLAPRRLLDDEAKEEGGEGSKAEQGWWGQVAALCGALLALTEEGDAQGREQALCTQSHGACVFVFACARLAGWLAGWLVGWSVGRCTHPSHADPSTKPPAALLELGKLSEAFAAALSACSLSPTPTTVSEPPASLLAPDGAGSKARANLCWVACLVALKQHTTQQSGGGDDGGPAQSPVLTVLQALLAAPASTSAARLSGTHIRRSWTSNNHQLTHSPPVHNPNIQPNPPHTAGLLELATLISEAIAPHAPPLSARLLKSVLEEILRVRALSICLSGWLSALHVTHREMYIHTYTQTRTHATQVWLTPQRPNSSSARPGSKRSRPDSSSSTSTTPASFPLTVPLPAPNAGADDAATHVGFFAVCRALLEATLRCSVSSFSSSSLPADNQQQQPESPSYPAEVFEDAAAVKECWRCVPVCPWSGRREMSGRREKYKTKQMDECVNDA